MSDQQVKNTEEVTGNTIIPDMKTGVLIEVFGCMFLILCSCPVWISIIKQVIYLIIICKSPQGLTEDPEPLLVTLLPNPPQMSFDEGCNNRKASANV